MHQSLTLGVGPSTSDQPQFLSPSISGATPRFKFLTLATQLIRNTTLMPNPIDRNLLREKIYNATMDYFCYQPMWIVGDIKALRQTMDSLIKFWSAVKEIKNVVAATQTFDTGPSTLPRNSSFWQALDSPSVQGSWLNTYSIRGSNSRSQSLNIPLMTSTGKRSTMVKSRVLLKRRNLILAILRHEVDRLSAWMNPFGAAELSIPGEDNLQAWTNPTQTDRNWQNTVTMAYQSSPHLAFYVYYRFRSNEAVTREFNRLIQTNPVAFIDIPEAAQTFASKEVVEKDSRELYHLLYWRGIPPAMALMYFTRPYSNHPITGQFANKAMQSFKPSDIVQFIPQVVQALRYDKLGFAKDYILTAARSSQVLAHQFLWNIQANTYTDEEGEIKEPEIGSLLEQLHKEILNNLSGAAKKFYEREFSFFKKVTDISGIIRPYPKPERKEQCLKALREVTLEPGVYLPSNPEAVVLGIDYDSGTPMQSAAKAPFLAKFKVQPCGIAEMEALNIQDDQTLAEDLQKFLSSDQSVWQGSIFKVGDDVRQDMLALQIIKFFKDIYDEIGLQLYLVPYRVVATAAGCGVIEVVPDSKSRDQLGKQTQVSLKEYFHSVYGDEDSYPYQEARSNFIRSMAAYSLITYLLQIKDRHNGNIMLDKWGHIIHIDFGFLFESSPGGNLGFEPDLKLTEEMLEIMGGKKSDSYKWFLELCVQGYLAVRPYQEQVVAMVTLMLDTGFPCFRGNTIDELRSRFRMNFSEKDAARAIVEVVESACLNFRTFSYDLIQDVQQNIYYHKKN
ncbi:PREDICTED: phosphatidylinositol 4-kinase alpha [Amphimedon queenslandica]|nr:PREDICTED: phosphatidylinositol 4-kinase alpha [Amphimedon queenslandica]|eukprot:XP_019860180.1 PREDICTED: phosphatidylinositol 4-kinase alpha [Amphimedon queenslandica]